MSPFVGHRRARFARERDRERERDRLAYETLVIREAEQDSMVWQTPALGMTGQAFLLTIAFSPDISGWARLATAAVGVIIAFATVQLIAKHRYLAEVDRSKMRDLERRLGLESIAHRRFTLTTRPPRTWWMRISSYRIWRNALFVLLAVNLLAVLLAVLALVGVEPGVPLLPAPASPPASSPDPSPAS